MNNTNFKAIPRNDAFIIPFELSQNRLAEWLLALSQQGGREACFQILYLLQALNKTKIADKNRIIFLNIISDYLTQYINLLDCPNSDGSFPLLEQEQDYAELVTWNYLTLGESFSIAAENAPTRDEEVFTLYMALNAIRKAQLHIATIYSTPSDGFWTLVYKIFAQAEKHKLLTLEINETTLKEVTVNKVFAQIIIFNLCDTYQFSPKEMQIIYNFLDKFCDNLLFYKLTDVDFKTDILETSHLYAINTITYKFDYLLQQLSSKLIVRNDLFIFDLSKDAAPINSDADLDKITTSTRYFCPNMVAKQIYERTKKSDLWGGVLKAIYNELFFRVAKVLEPGQKRKYSREKEDKTLLAIIGFECILSFLYKTAPKSNLKNVKTPQKPTPTFSTYEGLRTYADHLKKHSLSVTDKYADFEMGSRFNHPEAAPNNIWQSSKNLLVKPDKKVSLKQTTILDSSIKGYSVAWDDTTELTIKIGDIFGLISEDKKRLEIALIRRVKVNQGNGFVFGSEVLGFKSEIVYITHSNGDDGNETDPELAIFIPESAQLEQFDSLIYNSSKFKVGDMIYLHQNEKVTSCVLIKELYSGAAISHVELQY